MAECGRSGSSCIGELVALMGEKTNCPGIIGCCINEECRLSTGVEFDRTGGLTGKEENGPSLVDRLLGGRPLILPVNELLEEGHADDTAGPCRLLGLGFAADADVGILIEVRGIWSSCEVDV